MTAPAPSPYLQTLRWLSVNANFPVSRLPERAETLLLISTAALQEEVALQRSPRFLVERNDVVKDSSLKAYKMSRSLAHYVCNNAQKT